MILEKIPGSSRDLNSGPPDFLSDTLTTELLDPGGRECRKMAFP